MSTAAAAVNARQPVRIALVDQPAVLGALVRRHLNDNGNDRIAAMRGAVAEILADHGLLNDVLTEVVSEAVDRYVRRDMSDQRQRAVNTALDITRDAKARATDSLATLLHFPMRSGTKLQAAKKPEVEETATYYLRSGSTQVQRGLWLQSVAKKLPDDEVVVGRALGADAITDLYNAAVNRVRKMGLP